MTEFLIVLLAALFPAVAVGTVIAVFVYWRALFGLARVAVLVLMPRRDTGSVHCDDCRIPPAPAEFISSRDIVSAIRKAGAA